MESVPIDDDSMYAWRVEGNDDLEYVTVKLEDYSHLYRFLWWWEERNIEDFKDIQYIRKGLDVFEVHKIGILGASVYHPKHKYPVHTEYYSQGALPATKLEYDVFKQTLSFRR